ncbi:hypothetical protein DdX_10549 [Ditylenchus destructor]|uniref:Uncharacterized protein n=1 Tax=Ditylenchus destructor TaxID=166010 RepID=A0AAD4R5J4_9BILA|nr:hypothetical protein DdX_10549 [Ditylenchus destructor]
MEIAVQHQRISRFIHYSQVLVSLFWLSTCLLIYYHAPSYQVEKLYDCRWHMSSLAISAGFGLLFVSYSTSPLVFAASVVASQYSAVYSLLALIIYTVDTILILYFPQYGVDYTGYVKLATAMIVLSFFGLGLSLAHLYRLFLICWQLQRPSAFVRDERILQFVTGLQTSLALFTTYVVAELTSIKTWFVRSYVVSEFSCSLLSITLAFIQVLALRASNSWLIKAVVVMNICQFFQELNITLSLFHTYFYVGKLDSMMGLDGSLTQFRKIIFALNLLDHISRMSLCVFVTLNLSRNVFDKGLSSRVEHKVDSEMLTAEEQLMKEKSKENRWLFAVFGGICAIVFAHFVVNSGYVFIDAVYEALSVAAGLSVIFSVFLLISIVIYVARRLKIALVLSAFCSLNLCITAILLIFAFIQDIILATNMEFETSDLNSSEITTLYPDFTEISTTTAKDSEDFPTLESLRAWLYLSDFGLAIATMVIASLTLRFAFRQLLSVKTLKSQSPRVESAIKMLSHLGTVGVATCVFELLLLIQVRASTDQVYLNLNGNVYDWLVMTGQSILLCYICSHERYQALLLVLIIQVATMSTTSLELVAQQTEVVQMYINSVFRFYDLQKKPSAVSVVPIRSSEEPGFASALTTTTISPTTNAISAGLFVAVLALHFLQILQWILSIVTLALSLFVFDNLAKEDNSPISHNADNPAESDVSRLETNMEVRRSPSRTRAQPNSNGCFSFENRVFDENSMAEENGIEVRNENESL